MDMKIEHYGKMFGVIVGLKKTPNSDHDYDGVIVRHLQKAKVSWVNMLSPALHLEAYDKAYHLLTQFAIDNKFRYLIADPMNGVLRAAREDGSEPTTRVVRLIELNADEIHAKSEAAKRAAEAQGGAGQEEEIPESRPRPV